MLKFLERFQKTHFSLSIHTNNATDHTSQCVIEVHSDETILQSAARNGIMLPHKCRIGGCGTCKCQLLQGKIKPLTEFAYVLTAEELKAGFILACQSVPKSDISITVARLRHSSYQENRSHRELANQLPWEGNL